MDYNFVRQNHYALIKDVEAKFIFEQGEKHLKDLIETGQQIAKKTSNLLSIVSTLLIALVGFGITKLTATGFDVLVGTTLLSAIYLYVAAILLYQNIRPIRYQTLGLHPRRLFDDKLFNESNKEYRMEAIYINEIIECQKRIDTNTEVNEKRWRKYRLLLRMVLSFPIVVLGIYAFIYLILGL